MSSEDAVYRSVIQSLSNLNSDYVDLLLIHWPGTSKRKVSLPNTENRLAAWRALERLKREKKAHNIGVSNYTCKHLQELLAHAQELPCLNQIEMHPLCYNASRDVISMCERLGIRIQAYSVFGEGRLLERGGKYDIFDAIATRTEREEHMAPPTRAQLLVKWALQHGFSVVAKTVTVSRVRENFDVEFFHIPTEDMAFMDSLSQSGGLLQHEKFCWDPETVS